MIKIYQLQLRERLLRKIPHKIGNSHKNANEFKIIEDTINKYKNHPSIKAIKGNFNCNNKFKIEAAKVEQINKTQLK